MLPFGKVSKLHGQSLQLYFKQGFHFSALFLFTNKIPEFTFLFMIETSQERDAVKI